MFTDEEWKPVREFPDHYEISNYGRLRRIKPYRGMYAGQIKAPQKFGKYLGWLLSMSQVKVARNAHRLVADAFLGPIPKGMQVNHKDGDKHNNHVSNLEIVTNSENRAHSYRVLGVAPNAPKRGELNQRAKLTWRAVDDIRSSYASGTTATVLAARYGVTLQGVMAVVKEKVWQEANRPPHP